MKNKGFKTRNFRCDRDRKTGKGTGEIILNDGRGRVLHFTYGVKRAESEAVKK